MAMTKSLIIIKNKLNYFSLKFENWFSYYGGVMNKRIFFTSISVIAICFITGFLSIFTPYARAQILEIAAGGAVKAGAITLTGVTVRQLIADARQEAATLLADGRSAGDTLITRAGDELNMLADNAVRLVGDELDSNVEKIDESTRNVLMALHMATQSAKKMTKQVYDLKDTTALDLRSILGSIPLVKERLVLQRIDGLTQLKSSGDYSIELIGSYIGTPSEDHSSKIELKIDGATIDGVRFNPVGLHHTKLGIPNSALLGFFAENQLKIIPGAIVITQKFKEGFLIFKSWKEKKYEVPVHFSLFPSYAGTINVISRVKDLGWEKIGTKSNSATGGNNHCSKKCGGHQGSPYEVSVSVSGGERTPQHVGDQKITKIIECECVSGTCAFDHQNHSLVVLNATHAKCGWQGRSHPSTWRITAEVEQWSIAGERDLPQQLPIYWDRNIEIRIPRNSSAIRLTGKLITGESIDIIDGQPDLTGLLVRVKKVANLNDESLFYRINRPNGF